MKKFLLLIVGMMIITGGGLAHGQEKGTFIEAKALVKKAVAYVKEAGREKALAEFKNPKGKFINKDLYIWASDMNSVVLAHPMTPALTGKNMLELKDADGKYFAKEMVAIAQTKGMGTVDYRWTNWQTKQVAPKQVYFEVIDNMIISSACYK